ncbi:MAG: hypothetical protein ACK5BV_07005 [Bacteroidota bacterium]
MIDIELVKLNYARMEDAELISLTQTSGYELSTDAISALYYEFLKRKLDISIFPHLRAMKWQIHKNNLAKANKKKFDEKISNLLASSIKDLSQGESLGNVIKKLQRAGLRNKHCLNVLIYLKRYAIYKEENYHTKLLFASCIAFLGIFITALIIITSTMTDAILIGFLLIIVGVNKFISALTNKRKDRRLFNIINS